MHHWRNGPLGAMHNYAPTCINIHSQMYNYTVLCIKIRRFNRHGDTYAKYRGNFRWGMGLGGFVTGVDYRGLPTAADNKGIAT